VDDARFDGPLRRKPSASKGRSSGHPHPAMTRIRGHRSGRLWERVAGGFRRAAVGLAWLCDTRVG